MDHPATDATPFGRAVKKKAEEGGGWLSWVFNVDDISLIEDKFGRKAVEGNRKKPDGTELKWKQIGVLNILEDSQQPFYVQWISKDHPSSDGNAHADISELTISGESKKILKSLESLEETFLSKIKVIPPQEQQIGLKSVQFEVNGSKVIIE
jgi:hypothetical protein